LKESLNQGKKGPMSTASDNKDAMSSGSDSEEEFVEELPVTLSKSTAAGPRMSVSAEVFGKFNIEKEYKPPVYKKTEEQV